MRLFSSIRSGRPAILAIFRQPRVVSVRMVQSIATQADGMDHVKIDSLESNGHLPGTRSLALKEAEDDDQIRQNYRPFIVSKESGADWVEKLELETVLDMAERDLQNTGERLKVLVLYGSLRRR